MEETRKCVWCNEEFTPSTWHQKYCTAQCRMRGTFPRKPKETKRCKTCGSTFEGHGQQTYCKLECRPSRQPKPRVSRPPVDHSRVCSDCGDRWTPADHRRTKTTKCGACREKDRQTHVYTDLKRWKLAVRVRADYRCEECGRTAQEAGAPLHAHHIIPKSKGGENTLTNGKLLCVSCHDAAHADKDIYGVGFYEPKPPPTSTNLVDQIAQRVAELMSHDLERIEGRIASLEELAQRY